MNGCFPPPLSVGPYPVFLCSRFQAAQSELFGALGKNALNNSEAFAETTGNAAVVRAWDFKKPPEQGRKGALATLAAKQFCGQALDQAKPDGSVGAVGYGKKTIGLGTGRAAAWLVRRALDVIEAPESEVPVIVQHRNGPVAKMPTLGMTSPVRTCSRWIL